MRPERGVPQTRRSQDAARRIRDLIRAEMHRGAYSAGMLPSEEQLMRQMHVSRSVIRGAFALLKAEGLIERIQGIGTLVVTELQTMTLEESQGVASPHSEGATAGYRPRLISHDEIELPPPIARHLGVAPHSRGVRIDYVAMFDNGPLVVVTNYMRMPEAAKLASAQFTSDYYTYLLAAGIEVAETTYLMEAALADETDAELLGVAIGSAVMVVEQALLNADGEAFNYAFGRGRGDRHAILSRVSRRPQSHPAGESPADQS